eukprot:gene5136-8742_t
MSSVDDKISFSWERTDKTKNGNTNDISLPPQSTSSTLEININTTHISNVEIGSSAKKLVNIFLRDHSGNSIKKSWDTKVNLAQYVDEDFSETEEVWSLEGWSVKHPEAELMVTIRSWPEGSYNKSLENQFMASQKLRNSMGSFDIPETEREELERVNTTPIKYLKVEKETLEEESKSYQKDDWIYYTNDTFDNSNFDVDEIEENDERKSEEEKKKEEFDFAALGLDGSLDTNSNALKNLGTSLTSAVKDNKKKGILSPKLQPSEKVISSPISIPKPTSKNSSPSPSLKEDTITASPEKNKYINDNSPMIKPKTKEFDETDIELYHKTKRSTILKQSDFSPEDQLRIELEKSKNRIRELEEESSLLNKTLDKYVSASGKTSQDDLMQLKHAFDISKEQFRKIYNDKDLEIFALKTELKGRDEQVENLSKDLNKLKLDFDSQKLELSNSSSEIILLTAELERHRNFLGDLQDSNALDVVVVQKLKKLLSLEQSNRVFELEVSKLTIEKDEILLQKNEIENQYSQLKEEFRVKTSQIDELIMKDKQNSYELEVLEEQVQKGKEEIIGIQSSNRKYMSQVEKYEGEIEKLKSTIQHSKQDNVHLQNKIRTLDSQLATIRDGKDYDITPEVSMYKDEIQKHLMDKKRIEGDLDQTIEKSKERVRYFQSLNDTLTTELESIKFILRNQEEKQQKEMREHSNELQFLRQQMDKKVDKQLVELNEKKMESENKFQKLKKEIEEQHKIIQKKSKDEVDLTNSLSNLKEELTKATHQNVELQLKILQLEETVEKTVPSLSFSRQKHQQSMISPKSNSNHDLQFNEKNLLFIDPGQTITKEDLTVFPLLAVKKGILLLVSYFEGSVSDQNVSLQELGDCNLHPELVNLIIKTTCDTLSATFSHHYTGDSWFNFGSKVHFWKMLEELSTSHDREGQHGKELRDAINSANSYIDGFLRKNYLPDGMEIQDAKFDSFVFHCLNLTTLHSNVKYILKHTDVFENHYKKTSVMRNKEEQQKLIKFTSLLSKLPFRIDPLCHVKDFK